MLRCRRTDAYIAALTAAAEKHIRGKAVLDVGCGTGVLALTCARLGARVVYAVEASSMATVAEQIVKDNQMEGVVKVITYIETAAARSAQLAQSASTRSA